VSLISVSLVINTRLAMFINVSDSWCDDCLTLFYSTFSVVN
jgi:hypothetical protein